MIGPYLRGIYPNNRSVADEMAMNALPINIPAGKRYSRPTMLAGARPATGGRVPQRAAVEVAQLPEPPRRGGASGQQVALVSVPVPPPAPSHGGFRLIAAANAADAAPARRGPAAPGQWAIQVGAFGNQGQAHSALSTAQQHAHVELAVAHPYRRQRTSGPWRPVARTDDRDVARNRNAGLRETHPWPHVMHRAVAGSAIVDPAPGRSPWPAPCAARFMKCLCKGLSARRDRYVGIVSRPTCVGFAPFRG